MLWNLIMMSFLALLYKLVADVSLPHHEITSGNCLNAADERTQCRIVYKLRKATTVGCCEKCDTLIRYHSGWLDLTVLGALL